MRVCTSYSSTPISKISEISETCLLTQYTTPGHGPPPIRICSPPNTGTPSPPLRRRSAHLPHTDMHLRPSWGSSSITAPASITLQAFHPNTTAIIAPGSLYTEQSRTCVDKNFKPSFHLSLRYRTCDTVRPGAITLSKMFPFMVDGAFEDAEAGVDFLRRGS
jgi:hypothetical protein